MVVRSFGYVPPFLILNFTPLSIFYRFCCFFNQFEYFIKKDILLL